MHGCHAYIETDHNGIKRRDHWDASVQEHVGEQGHHGEGEFPPLTHCNWCRFSTAGTGWRSLCIIVDIILLCAWGMVLFRQQSGFFWHATVFQNSARDSPEWRSSAKSEKGLNQHCTATKEIQDVNTPYMRSYAYRIGEMLVHVLYILIRMAIVFVHSITDTMTHGQLHGLLPTSYWCLGESIQSRESSSTRVGESMSPWVEWL